MIDKDIKFTIADDIDEYAELAQEFISTIFGINNYLITEMSSLSDFSNCCYPDDLPDPATYEEYQRISEETMIDRISANYMIVVDPGDLLVDVFRKIDESRKPVVYH